MLPLGEWESFYVIVGSSAGALTGLMFVVIALAAEARTVDDAGALRAFASPNVVHFCAVLLLSAVLSMPRHSIASLRACLLAFGAGGLGYLVWVVVQARRQESYDPVLSDWIWHTALPILAYGGVEFAGERLARTPEIALDVVGGAALLLLFVGLHNAWDSAVWMTRKIPREPGA